MFGWFKKKSERERLEIQYKKLLKEAFDLSKTNRTASDLKTQEAEAILKQIQELDERSASN